MLNLNSTLEKFILDLSASKKSKLKIIEAGCGQGIVVDSLLNNTELDVAIDSITAISLHYFKNIEQVMLRHGKRLNYYLGSAQTVLPTMPACADVIFDIWGAYPYSEDKLDLLRLYHGALSPNGIALISSGDKASSAKLQVGDEKVDMIPWLCEHYRVCCTRCLVPEVAIFITQIT